MISVKLIDIFIPEISPRRSCHVLKRRRAVLLFGSNAEMYAAIMSSSTVWTFPEHHMLVVYINIPAAIQSEKWTHDREVVG